MFKPNKKNEPLDLRGTDNHQEKVNNDHKTLERMEIALDMRLKNRKVAQEEEKIQNNEDVSDGLKEIYEIDKNGDADIGNIKKNKINALFFWLNRLFIIIIFAIGTWFAFNYYIGLNHDNSGKIIFNIENEKQVMINEEFLYTIKYENLNNFNLNNVEIKIEYPDNFIFLDSVPEKNSDIGDFKVWNIDKVFANSGGEIKIKGKIINKSNFNILLAEMVYRPDNFSSNLKNEISSHISLKEQDWNWKIETPATILVNETEDIFFEFKIGNENYLGNFILDVAAPNGMDIANISTEKEGNALISRIDDSNSWQLSNLDNNNKFKIQFKFIERLGDNKNIEFKFKKQENGKDYIFFNEKQELEVIKSDLDLVLIINGSSENKPVNFGEKLNYSISYTNKGETSLEDVSIMVVLNSNFLDWTTFKDNNYGVEKGNAVVWGKNQIPQLSNLDVGENGNIDFSVNVTPFVINDKNLEKDVSIESYARFNIRSSFASSSLGILASSSDTIKNGDNQSNLIINKINSDLSLGEEIRYFNDDNIPVGTGPLPPKVGEETSFKVYWSIKNNLHELGDIKVVTQLPEYIKWNNKERTSVGNLLYNEESHSVTWDVGKLPLAIYRADAEFSINITPNIEDKNKILIFLTGTEISAIDMQTKSKIINNTMSKTSKLESDEIAQSSSDGRIVE